MRLKCIISVALLLLGLSTGKMSAQNVAVKTNALYWATTTPNLGVEVAIQPFPYDVYTFEINIKFKEKPTQKFLETYRFTRIILERDRRETLPLSFSFYYFGYSIFFLLSVISSTLSACPYLPATTSLSADMNSKSSCGRNTWWLLPYII